MDEKLGARIRRLRLEQGLGQAELSERCGWPATPARVSNYERGERPVDVASAEALAQALGTTAAHVLFGLDPETMMVVTTEEREVLLALRAQRAARSSAALVGQDGVNQVERLGQAAVNRPTRPSPKRSLVRLGESPKRPARRKRA